jgi:hypothetical protein
MQFSIAEPSRSVCRICAQGHRTGEQQVLQDSTPYELSIWFMLGFFGNAFANDSPNLVLDAHRRRRGVREVMVNTGPRSRNDLEPAGNEKGVK